GNLPGRSDSVMQRAALMAAANSYMRRLVVVVDSSPRAWQGLDTADRAGPDRRITFRTAFPSRAANLVSFGPSAFAVYCSISTSVSCVHHETSCWPPSMSYVAPVSAVLLMM